MDENLHRIADIRQLFRKRLSHIYHERESDAIAGIIIRALLKTGRMEELLNPDIIVPLRMKGKILKICDELSAGKPVQYITGETEFHGCRLKVNSHTLIPRQETEELVSLIIKENRGCSPAVLDIGTGPGTIAVPLALNMPGSEIHAIDKSVETLNVARKNAGLNKAKISFMRADILDPSWKPARRYNIVVSNPPYVPESEKSSLHINVTNYEPHEALFVPDNDPVVFYRAIARRKNDLLLPGAVVYFEIHERMGQAVRNLLREEGFGNLRVIKDLNERDRIATGSYNGRDKRIRKVS